MPQTNASSSTTGPKIKNLQEVSLSVDTNRFDSLLEDPEINEEISATSNSDAVPFLSEIAASSTAIGILDHPTSVVVPNQIEMAVFGSLPIDAVTVAWLGRRLSLCCLGFGPAESCSGGCRFVSKVAVVFVAVFVALRKFASGMAGKSVVWSDLCSFLVAVCLLLVFPFLAAGCACRPGNFVKLDAVAEILRKIWWFVDVAVAI
ncbi:hypothetical protein U1Q18_002230 [Sarracenia purpurea var. burkii]